MNNYGISIASPLTTGVHSTAKPLIIDAVIFDIMTLDVVEVKSFFFDFIIAEDMRSFYTDYDIKRHNVNKVSALKAFSQLYHFIDKYTKDKNPMQVLVHNPTFEIMMIENICELNKYPRNYLSTRFSNFIDISVIGRFINSVYRSVDRESLKSFDDNGNESVKLNNLRKAYGVKEPMEKAVDLLTIYREMIGEFVSDKVHELCIHCGATAVSVSDNKCIICGMLNNA